MENLITLGLLVLLQAVLGFDYCDKVSAVDAHDNESGFAMIGPRK